MAGGGGFYRGDSGIEAGVGATVAAATDNGRNCALRTATAKQIVNWLVIRIQDHFLNAGLTYSF